MIILREPREVWKVFALAYRAEQPRASTTASYDEMVARVIDDIYEGRPIRWRTSIKLDMNPREGVGCCTHFMDFLNDLQGFMAAEFVADVPPRRAVNLLYNNDAFNDWPQPLLNMAKFKDEFHLFSTPYFEDMVGIRVELALPDCCPADAPSIKGW